MTNNTKAEAKGNVRVLRVTECYCQETMRGHKCFNLFECICKMWWDQDNDLSATF